jgi:hypothetical protein
MDNVQKPNKSNLNLFLFIWGFTAYNIILVLYWVQIYTLYDQTHILLTSVKAVIAHHNILFQQHR